MCSSHDTKSVPAETKVPLPVMGRSGSSSRAGAKARRSPLATPPTEPSSPLLAPKPEIKDEDDDIFAGLSLLFGGVQLDDCDDSESESEDAPPSPAAKGIDPAFITGRRTYFYATGRLYFFDDERNVYLDNSPGEVTLRHVGKPFMLEESGMFNPDFFIDGVPYYFDGINNALLYEDQGTYRNVYTWAGESDTNTFNEAFNPTFVPRTTTGGVFQSNNLTFDHYSAPTYYEETKQTPWSPGSSTLSPIVSSGSRASSEGLEPLIPAGYGGVIDMWNSETQKIQAERAPPPNKMDRRRCPVCNKVFRRPSSLEDHLNVHSGEKPHTCPFPSCNTGFATKSNMKRHFLTHRVLGTVEEYSKGVGKIAKTKSKALTTTYNSKAFHTQRFRLTT